MGITLVEHNRRSQLLVTHESQQLVIQRLRTVVMGITLVEHNRISQLLVVITIADDYCG